MEQIVEAKSILKKKDLLAVLAESVYNPTEERLMNRANNYIINPNTAVYANKENDTYKGIIVIDFSNINAIEILDIAVSASFQKSGIGSSLINHCINMFHPDEIIAETDDDAVEFYEKFGFHILSLGDKYGAGIMRYQCTFKCK
ncbi:GNAT family N-acetyltransferase [Anaerocolumna sedimenticola]|uniref:GNAT family N-acetyltransferase n=1 Tax=Anaerocolumna sedimenticola TaxID=2696063 RepID=A0A6P1TNH0_9FIRM|nr:GNAT family N-acetyltransferase [Anaerocolumna sedimenticola]QHQ62013.1 GNAT family N-acetyltransferase [Anaerocolumna sedimenticola]